MIKHIKLPVILKIVASIEIGFSSLFLLFFGFLALRTLLVCMLNIIPDDLHEFCSNNDYPGFFIPILILFIPTLISGIAILKGNLLAWLIVVPFFISLIIISAQFFSGSKNVVMFSVLLPYLLIMVLLYNFNGVFKMKL